MSDQPLTSPTSPEGPMDYAEYVKQVMDYAEFESSDQAERVIMQSLATFGERIYRTKRDYLAAQLPTRLKQYLYSRADPETTRGDTAGFSLEEFYNRVSARAEVGFPEAIEGSRAVMMVLQQAVTQPVIDEVLSDLPEEYQELFGAEPHSPASPTTLAEG